MLRSLVPAALLVSCTIFPCWLNASDLLQQQIEFFESKVRPVLISRCYDCHSGDDVESELNLDSLAGILNGGARGAAIIPKDSDKSLLILAINHADQLHMPPKSKIPANEIANLTKWVKMGAPWPDAEPVTSVVQPVTLSPKFTDEQRNFWAFQPLRHDWYATINRSDWITSPLDSFILAKLKLVELPPAPPADRRTLLRRVTYDLTGLPPSMDAVDRFVADKSPDAFERTIDHLLSSPRYGERWGRHWLDVARYADSNGLDENLAYANAYRYRDYVVTAFNQDKPYNRFIIEQLAGDLLPADDSTPLAERLTATGFLSLGAKMLAEDDPVKMQMDIIDEQVETMGRAFMGLTLGCARCHDHKFDPIPTADYYSLAGIFKSTKTMENFNVVARWQERPLVSPEKTKEREAHQAKITAKQTEIDLLEAEATKRILNEARRHVGDYLLASHELDRLDELAAQAKTLGNEPEKWNGIGAILIETEAYDRGNVLKDTTNYGKGVGVLVNAGEVPNFVEYDVEVDSTGIYQLELRYAAASSRPCSIIINGDEVKSNAAAEVTGSWFPDSQQWFVEGAFRLAKGKNIIRLEQPTFFPHVDKILLVPASVTNKGLQRADTEYQPIAELVRQWSDYLKKGRGNSDSIFAAWHLALSGGDQSELTGLGVEVRDKLFDNTTSRDIRSLALRYNDLFRNSNPKRLETSLEKALRKILMDAEGPFAIPKNVELHYPKDASKQLATLAQERKSLEETLPQFPDAMVVSDATPENIPIHIRGSHITLGNKVPRQFPQILAGSEQTPIGNDRSGRLELARWLSEDSSPLTSRVMANRIWLGHFGEALVRSPNNFGSLGERPTHPDLLEFLATQLVASGWSVKTLHRLIMLSSTYRMSTEWNEKAAAADPKNRLVWRMNRRRLEVEAIRDSILNVGRSIDLTMGGSMLPTANRAYVTSTANVDPVVYQTTRRSIYLPVVRSALYDVFQSFDFAEPSVSSGQRDSTTIATQALFMMNSSLVSKQCLELARDLLNDNTTNDETRVLALYQHVFRRSPTADEIRAATDYTERYLEAAIAKGRKSEESSQRAWQSLCRALVSSSEFIYLD